MSKIKAMIIDDMPLAIASLKADLEEFNDIVEIVSTAEGVMEAAKNIKKTKPELLFLDIHMGDGDGFDLLDIVEHDCAVIFTTASKDYALKAFQFSALDYLLKPIDPDLLKVALGKAQIHFEKRKIKEPNSEALSKGTIALNTQEEIRLVQINSIIRLEAMGNYTTFHIEGQDKILVTKTMKEFEKVLPESFLRVHQSHLVNKKHIKSYVKTEGGYLLMKDEMTIPVSVRKKAFVMEALGKNT